MPQLPRPIDHLEKEVEDARGRSRDYRRQIADALRLEERLDRPGVEKERLKAWIKDLGGPSKTIADIVEGDPVKR